MSHKAVYFQKSNIEDLKGKLAELISDQAEVRHYKSGAQDYICKKYDWDEITERTLQLYKK